MAAVLVGCAAGALPAPATAQLFVDDPIILAIRDGDITEVEAAFLAGQTANERSFRGVPALTVAVGTGNTQIVQLLLSRGARVNATSSRDGQTALEEAVRINRTDIVQILIDAGADVDKPGTNGQTPLMLAAQLGHTNVVKVLIDADAYLNDTDRTGRTPLDLAKERRHAHTAAVLEAAGAE